MMRSVVVGALAWICAGPPTYAAETYPGRPIRLVAPFAPGGGVDVSARFNNSADS